MKHDHEYDGKDMTATQDIADRAECLSKHIESITNVTEATLIGMIRGLVGAIREHNEAETHLIAVGNAFDGLSFIGPFNDFDSAYHYTQQVEEEWNIITLAKPE